MEEILVRRILIRFSVISILRDKYRVPTTNLSADHYIKCAFKTEAMSAQYQRFLKLLEKWPADKRKVGRDLGEQIRKLVSDLTNPANLTPETSERLTKKIEVLERLANNVHGKKYPRTLNSTATGLTSEQCGQVLSSEFLEYLNEESSSKKKKRT